MSAEERGKIGFRARGGWCAEYVGVRRHAQSVTGQQWVTFWALLGRGRAQKKKKIAPQRPRVEKKKKRVPLRAKKGGSCSGCVFRWLLSGHLPLPDQLAGHCNPPTRPGRSPKKPPAQLEHNDKGALPSMVKIFIAARQGGGLEGPGGRQITAAAPLSSLTIEALESKRFSARLQGQAISE